MEYVLGLGTNIGDKIKNLQHAIEKLHELGDVTAQSNIYKSKALLPPNAPIGWDMDYYNMAIVLNSKLQPIPLLEGIKKIEAELGRELGSLRWAPRVIDIDILLAEDTILNHSQLTIPHPELAKRNFALLPCSEIMPDFVHPIFQQSLRELSNVLNNDGLSKI